MTTITTQAGNTVRLINGTVAVSALYRCPKCNAYPGELHQRDEWKADHQHVLTTYTCPTCGHVTHDDPMPC